MTTTTAAATSQDPETRVRELTAQVDRLEKELEQARAAPLRRRLPDTRQSVTHAFRIGPKRRGYLTVGLYEDGRPAELFIKMAKQGTPVRGLLDTVGILTSLLLQHGIPLERLVEKLSHTRFNPCGFTNNPDIRIAKSPIDYIFRWLGQHFVEAQEDDLGKECLPPHEEPE